MKNTENKTLKLDKYDTNTHTSWMKLGDQCLYFNHCTFP